MINLDNGETYLINAERKGTFMMRVESQCETWVNGILVGGETDARLVENKSGLGEEVSCRKGLIQKATKQPK